MLKFSAYARYFLLSFFLCEMIVFVMSAPAVVPDNWSTEEYSEEGTETENEKVKPSATTKAPVVLVTVPPIAPIPPMKQKPESIEEPSAPSPTASGKAEDSKEYSYETYEESSYIYRSSESETYEYTSESETEESCEGDSCSEEKSTTTTKKPTFTEPPIVIPGSGESTVYPAIPIKMPFVPVSGPKVEIGTVLKPAGFNGLKPVAKPKQVQSLPYESWADSPLSMAPKKKSS